MDMLHLLYFKSVVEKGSVSEAARALFISQPALSASIAKVEADVGVPLFDRNGRRIVLNRAGKIYYDSVLAALSALQQGKRSALSVAEGTENVISIAAFTYVSFSTITQPFLAKTSNCSFKLWQMDDSNITEQFLTGNIDFAITCSPIDSPSIGCYHLLTQRLYLTVPREHPLANCSYIRLSDVKDEPFVLLSQDAPFRAITDQIFREAGFFPKVSCELTNASLMAGMINSGAGISILPDTFAEHRALSKINITFPKCFHNAYFLWSKDRDLSPAAQKFMQFVIEYYRNFPKDPGSI